MRAPSDPVVVVSPHLDDAVLSLGAFIARAARSGQRVTVLTVFAGNPDSIAPAGGWDRRGGYTTEGEATRARRLEDGEACRFVGAEPAWLSFSEADYRDSIDENAIWSAVRAAVASAGAQVVLIPGFPLTNPDHALLSALLVRRGLHCRRIGLYAEQPYRYTVRREKPRPDAPDLLQQSLDDTPAWTHVGARPREMWTKRRAILAYRSQMPLLGLAQRRHRKLNRMLAYEILRHGEAIMWLLAR